MASDDPVLSRGLSHSDDERPLLEAAVTSANRMTGDRGPSLVPSWLNADPKGKSVPVYLVEAPVDAAATPAVVPRDCTCVLVNASAFLKWLRAHSTGPAHLELEPRHLLTFMLLHEVGHLHKRTSGSEFSNGSLSQLNVDPSLAKVAEEEADEFAAELIRNGSTSSDWSTMSDANWVAIELTKLSWNMQAYRSLEEFGAMATGKPAVFFDQNLTHPNLAWRVLRSNVLIQQSDDSRELLAEFEKARERGASEQPLHVEP